MEPLNTELILIRITGEDRPGLTSSIMGILARYDVTVLDIGQADIHNTLTLGLLVRAAEEYSGHVMRDLLFKASELGVNIRFYPVKKDEYADWVNMQGKNRYILTLLGRKLSALQIQAVTSVLAEQGLIIDAIKRLTGRIPLDEQRENIRACIEFSVRGTPKDRAAMQSKLLKLSSELEMDFSFQLDNMYRRMRRLICFDMDSTLIETEVIDELADRAGVGDQVRAITEQAMRGEIDFKESFTQRVAFSERGGCVGDGGYRAAFAYHGGSGSPDVRIETVWLQDCHPFGRFHLFRQLPEEQIRHRLCVCQ